MERKIIILLLCAVGFTVSAYAWAVSPTLLVRGELVTEYSATAELQFLRSTVNKAIETNPEFAAQKASAESARAKLEGAGLPLYNPSLAVEVARAEDNTLALGLTQTLDWHDKQLGQQALQQVEVDISNAELTQLIMSLATHVLNAMADYYNALEMSGLHKKRVMLLEQIVQIAEKRLAAGDINKSEVLLARLSLADAVIDHARQSANVIEAQKSFFILSQQQITAAPAFVMPLPDGIGDDVNLDELARRHPLEKIALLRVELSKREVTSVNRERRADPELGFKVGKEGEDALVGVEFSMPWQVRNNLSSTVKVAQKTQLQTEFQAQHTHRRIMADIKAAKSQYHLIAKAWKVWLSNGENQLKEHIELLEQRWNSGELSTTDYLVQLEQNLHTQIAGVELKGSVWRTWFQWLNATAQVLVWLTLDEDYLINTD